MARVATRAFVALLLGAPLMAASPRPAAAEPGPRQTLETADQRIRAALAARDDRDEELRQVVGELLDVEQMARDALGPHWGLASEPERRELIDLLRRLIDRSYLDLVRDGLAYDLRFGQVSVDRDRAWVEAVIRASSADRSERSLQVELVMARRPEDARWRVIEVVTDGARLVRGYRIQFARVIRREGLPALIRRMRERLEDGSPRQ
jgi:phospholipid transport system substrate-binding protein